MVVQTRKAKPQAEAAEKRPSRGSERGAVIFVVILVLTVLTAIGIFAANAAGLNQRVSGYSRQSTQNGYVAEYGAAAVAAELGGPMKDNLLRLAAEGQDQCSVLQNMPDGGAGRDCRQVFVGELQKSLADQGASGAYFDPDGGSLGATQQPLAADFRVEMTEQSTAPGRVSGTRQDDTETQFQNRQVTLTAFGQVRPTSASDSDAGVCNTETEQQSAAVAGSRSMRVYVTVRSVAR